MANSEYLKILKSGVDKWNKWRFENWNIIPKLSGANLSEADLSRADLSGADLSEADLSRADLSRADLSEADLSGADLSRADLSGADLSGADLRGADLRGADLDFSCLPLWCGSFAAKIDRRLFFQIVCKLHRFEIEDKECLEYLKKTDEYKNIFCEYRDVKKI